MYKTETVTLLKSEDEKVLNNEIVELDKKIKNLGKEYAKENVKKSVSEKEKQIKLEQLEREVKFCIKQRNELQDKLYRKEICDA